MNFAFLNSAKVDSGNGTEQSGRESGPNQSIIIRTKYLLSIPPSLSSRPVPFRPSIQTGSMDTGYLINDAFEIILRLVSSHIPSALILLILNTNSRPAGRSVGSEGLVPNLPH